MRITVDIDDRLLGQASSAIGVMDTTELVHKGLRALVGLENARAIIALGGSDPNAKAAPRRRPPDLLNPD